MCVKNYIVSYHHPLEEGLGPFSNTASAVCSSQLPSSIRRRIRTSHRIFQLSSFRRQLPSSIRRRIRTFQCAQQVAGSCGQLPSSIRRRIRTQNISTPSSSLIASVTIIHQKKDQDPTCATFFQVFLSQLPSSIRRRIRTKIRYPQIIWKKVSYHHPLEEGLGRVSIETLKALIQGQLPSSIRRRIRTLQDLLFINIFTTGQLPSSIRRRIRTLLPEQRDFSFSRASGTIIHQKKDQDLCAYPTRPPWRVSVTIIHQKKDQDTQSIAMLGDLPFPCQLPSSIRRRIRTTDRYVSQIFTA